MILKIERINELQKKKTEGLTAEEKVERQPQ